VSGSVDHSSLGPASERLMTTTGSIISSSRDVRLTAVRVIGPVVVVNTAPPDDNIQRYTVDLIITHPAYTAASHSL